MAPEGRQSPDPETQTSAQIGQPASGKNEQTNEKDYPNKEEQLKNLESNPKGPLDDIVKDKFAKTQNPAADSSK